MASRPPLSSPSVASKSFPNSMLLSVLLVALLLSGAVPSGGFQFEEATVERIQLAFDRGEFTSTRLVAYYLERVRALNPLLHAVIEVNPDALVQAGLADGERARMKGRRGALHGVPVLLRDNVATRDRFNTTAGSLALLGSVVPHDAGVVERLRAARAVILGKASLSEWSGFRSIPKRPSGWSARGGQGKILEHRHMRVTATLLAALTERGRSPAIAAHLHRSTGTGNAITLFCLQWYRKIWLFLVSS